MKDRRQPSKETEKERAERRVRDLAQEVERLKREIEKHLATINQQGLKTDRNTS